MEDKDDNSGADSSFTDCAIGYMYNAGKTLTMALPFTIEIINTPRNTETEREEAPNSRRQQSTITPDTEDQMTKTNQRNCRSAHYGF